MQAFRSPDDIQVPITKTRGASLVHRAGWILLRAGFDVTRHNRWLFIRPKTNLDLGAYFAKVKVKRFVIIDGEECTIIYVPTANDNTDTFGSLGSRSRPGQ